MRAPDWEVRLEREHHQRNGRTFQLRAPSHFGRLQEFAGASRLFRSDMRASAQLLYAWCRHCDDARWPGGGLQGRGRDARRDRGALSCTQTQRAIDGGADSPAFAALAYAVKRHEIPERFPFELLDGFEMDAIGHHYKSIDDTILYSYYVAGVVGVMMAMIMGVRDDEVLDRACDLGIGFQLTNISRDVMDDWNIGRVYLPQDWLDEMGVLVTTSARQNLVSLCLGLWTDC